MLQDYFGGALRLELGHARTQTGHRSRPGHHFLQIGSYKLHLDRDDLDLNHPNNSPEEACRVEQQTDLPDDVFLQSFEMA